MSRQTLSEQWATEVARLARLKHAGRVQPIETGRKSDGKTGHRDGLSVERDRWCAALVALAEAEIPLRSHLMRDPSAVEVREALEELRDAADVVRRRWAAVEMGFCGLPVLPMVGQVCLLPPGHDGDHSPRLAA